MYKKALLLTLLLTLIGVFTLSVLFVFFGNSSITKYVQSSMHSSGISIPAVLWEDGVINFTHVGAVKTAPKEKSSSEELMDLVEFDVSFLNAFIDTKNGHFNKDLNKISNNWHWTEDLVVADVIGVENDSPFVGVRITFPTTKAFSNKLLSTKIECPKEETSIVSSLNFDVIESDTNIYEHVEKGDVLYTRCGDKGCSYFTGGCVLIKRVLLEN